MIAELVADWSQAEIGYTTIHCASSAWLVADWSQAEIGYTAFLAKCLVFNRLHKKKIKKALAGTVRARVFFAFFPKKPPSSRIVCL